MIAAIAVTMALAFWQPYSPEPICPGGVDVYYFTDAQHHSDQPDTKIWGWTDIPGARDCRVGVNVDLPKQPIEFQCAVVAHELGHVELGLEHSADPRNIMYWDVPTPAACKLPPTPRAKRAKRAHHRPAHRRPDAFHT